VKWDDSSTVELIYLITDYESLFRDPLNYGVYKAVGTDMLMQAWIDQQDLTFTWEKQIYSDGSFTERPIMGSNKQVHGALKDVVQFLRDNAPAVSSLPSMLPYDVQAFQRKWERQDFGGRLAIPQIPGTTRNVFGVNDPVPDVSESATSLIQYLDSYTWRAVVVDWNATSPLELIFIINNYEDFYRNPLANGVYKYVDRELLLRNWIDRQDVIFSWEKRWYDDSTTTEAPVIGSHKEVYGALVDIVKMLRENAP